ncbi:MAG: hypothetical protein AAF700_08840 [Pseudomonadota bacterium]
MILFALLLVSLVIAILLSIIGGRFELRKPAVVLTGAGFFGAVLFVAVSGLADDAVFATLAIIGPLICVIAVIGLLSLAILWAYRRWSGFYEER